MPSFQTVSKPDRLAIAAPLFRFLGLPPPCLLCDLPLPRRRLFGSLPRRGLLGSLAVQSRRGNGPVKHREQPLEITTEPVLAELEGLTARQRRQAWRQ
jgi:hypothetical protein